MSPMHYHWRDDKFRALRLCPFDDELTEATFWVPEPPADDDPQPGVDLSGWSDLGFTTDEGRPEQ